MTAIRTLRRFALSRSGTAAIEFGFIAPILVAMFAAVVEFGRLYQVYNATNRLASQYAIVWADCSDVTAGVCTGELGTLGSPTTISNIVPQLQANATLLSAYQLKMTNGTLSVNYAWPTGSTITAAQMSAAQAVITLNGQSGVVVTATYNHSLQFFQILMSQYVSSMLTPTYTVAQLKT